MSIEQSTKNLPYELQDKIYQYYWSYVHYNILNEIKEIIFLDKKINNFIKRYDNNIIKKNNNYYYKQFNFLIKEITCNKGKMLLCKYNNLSLRYCTTNYINNVCSNINDDYKYIAPILICKSYHLRYYVLHYLKSL